MRARILAAFVFLLTGIAAAPAAEVIHRYDQLVRVAKDGTLTVTETIRVRAEGSEIKRGIYREFPVTFEDRDKKSREVTFKVLGVTRDGNVEPWFTRKQGRFVRIYEGSQNVMLRTGDYTYQFTYQTGRQIRWFDGKPELYWNVTGNAWNFPILAASVRVEMPGNVQPERWTAYTGRYGEQGKDWRGQTGVNGALVVETTRALPPGQGFTIVASYPQGVIDPPSPSQELWYQFLDYRQWFLAGIGSLAVFIYYLFAWTLVGRDPKSGTIIPLFHPPKNISPALASYIHNWGLGGDKWRAFTAASLSLAVKGLLIFDNKDSKLTLRSTGKEAGRGETLPPGEREILSWVKSEGGVAEITRGNGTAVKSGGDKFEEAVDAEGKNKFFRRNLGYWFAGLALTIVTVASVIVFGNIQPEDFGIMFFVVFFSIFFGAFIIPMLRALFDVSHGQSEIYTALKFIAFLGFAGYAVAEILSASSTKISDILPIATDILFAHPFPVALVGSLATLNGLFFYLLKAPTATGRPLMDQIAGFRMYLETAESPRLNTVAPEITAERFEQILPYAVALDVEKPWSNAFQAALQKAYPNDDPSSHYTPRWNNGYAWSGNNFGNAMSSTVAAASSALSNAIPPSSSGSSGFSSGGGGSGGGGGGGGGGGW